MRKLSLLFLCLLGLTLVNCSSSDDSSSGNNPPSLPTENSFSVVIEGSTYTFTTFTAVKYFDNFEVVGTNDNDENFYLKFNAAGVLDRANFYSTDFSLDINYNSAFYYPSFNFDLSTVAIDPNNMVVSADFSGMIYEDDISLSNGNSLMVDSGSFNLVYQELQLPYDLHVDATIDGQSYQSVKYSESSGFNGTDIELTGHSDGLLNLGIIINPNTVEPGTYTFTDSNAANSVSLELANLFTDEYERMDVNGTITIDEVVEGFPSYVSGTFSLTATSEGGTVYNVTNGSFIQAY